MKLFERAVRFVAEPDGEPIEKFGVSGSSCHVAEIVGRVHESAAEMIMPYAVDDVAPRQDVSIVGEPIRQRGAALAFVAFIGKEKIARQIGDAMKRARRDDFAWAIQVTTDEDVNG